MWKPRKLKLSLLYFYFLSKWSTSDIVHNGPPLSWMLWGEVPAYRANRATLPHPPMHISGSCGQKSNYLIYSCIYLCARATEGWLPNTSIQTCLKSGKSKYQRAMKIKKNEIFGILSTPVKSWSLTKEVFLAFMLRFSWLITQRSWLSLCFLYAKSVLEARGERF